MGRYITGDIERKLWFAVQPSNAADQFGVVGVQPNSLYYYFDKDDLETLNTRLKELRQDIGENYNKLKNFFKKVEYYSIEDIENLLKLKDKIVIDNILKVYADIELGEDIKRQIELTGECEFYAEL